MKSQHYFTVGFHFYLTCILPDMKDANQIGKIRPSVFMSLICAVSTDSWEAGFIKFMLRISEYVDVYL